MLRFEKEVPREFRLADKTIIVRSVGELIDQLSKLPRGLSLDGYFGRGVCKVSVVHIVGRDERLACCVEEYDVGEDEDEDDAE